MSSDAWLVAGLGNPGPGYANNRHNVGQMVLDLLAARLDGRFRSSKAQAVASEGRMGPGGPRLVLAKPLTYMNLTGGPVAALARFHDVAPDHVIAVHDEIDVPFNTVRLKFGGGEGGHNGLRDISRALGTKDYYRVRVGVGRPPGRQDAADHVLKNFGTAEMKDLAFLLEDAADAVEALILEGLASAQQKFHSAM
ncbi:aminoacyl-tRNA hydrolase [Arthrobacter sp. Br18]|uniref:aminoacyl-tRNA hydrolase n=1 Tax=Arthrobacter sp. Br18 TaxID=1312954 RepID=UPI00047BBA0B|nr:aminoacyl-tRNA hydrolase [Arthrobacter sp. Br18]